MNTKLSRFVFFISLMLEIRTDRMGRSAIDKWLDLTNRKSGKKPSAAWQRVNMFSGIVSVKTS